VAEMMKLFRYGTSKNFIRIKRWLTAAMLGAKLPASGFLSNYRESYFVSEPDVVIYYFIRENER
jgi:hypothetical protein